MNGQQRTRVKMCGIVTAQEALLAVEAGADAIGVIVAPSPRRADPSALPNIAAEIPPFVERIGVVVNPTPAQAAEVRAHGFTFQFSGDEPPELCRQLAQAHTYVKTFHIRSDTSYDLADFEELSAYVGATWLFDSRVDARRGGTGVPFLWPVVAPVAARRNIIVSGGLTAVNVGDCIRAVRPYAVDVRSGVETNGQKDIVKMRAFVRAVNEADAKA